MAWRSYCDRKNIFYFSFVNEPIEENNVTCKKMKACVKKHISKAKSKYYHKYFLENQVNSKKQWQIINKLLKRKRNKAEVTKLIDDDGNGTNNAKEISEKFNHYFANIAKNLKSSNNQNRSTSPSENSYGYEEFMGPSKTKTIFLEPATLI